MAAKKQKRVIHYGSVGSGGLAFRCYFDELNKHLKSGSPAKSKGGYVDITKYTLPNPLTTTDLRKVTCPPILPLLIFQLKTTFRGILNYPQNQPERFWCVFFAIS
ncbi:hypothetical protein ES708_14307 [subsurface metagenome]